MSECEKCHNTGYEPKEIKVAGMNAGEMPRLEFNFKPCGDGCPGNQELLKTLLGEEFTEVF